MHISILEMKPIMVAFIKERKLLPSSRILRTIGGGTEIAMNRGEFLMCIDINFTRLGAGVYFVALLHIEH